MSATAWSDEENDAIVAAGFAMLTDDLAGCPVNKPRAFELHPPLLAHLALIATSYSASFH